MQNQKSKETYFFSIYSAGPVGSMASLWWTSLAKMGGISMHNHMAVNVQGIRHHQWMKWNVLHNAKAIKVLMLPGKYKFFKSLSSLNLIKSIRVVLRIRT